MNKYSLNTNWCLWYHSIKDKTWTNKSYRLLFTINNFYDIYSLQNIISKNHLQNAMFFCMKEDIFPTWEDPDNREGCCISFKIPNKDLKSEWDQILIKSIIEEILQNESYSDQLNGISIAPKKEFNIIKLWLRNQTDDYLEICKEYEPYFLKEKSLTKNHELNKK